MSTFLWYPIADKCVNRCLYCFEDPDFKSETSVFNNFDREKMSKTMKNLVGRSESYKIVLHGGEVLSLPIDDFEFFLKETRKYEDRVSIQTSLGLPLSPEHLRLMSVYGVDLGISVDGPQEFNILRGPRQLEANKKFQDVVYDNIRLLNSNGIRFGLITILSKANATKDKIDTTIKWCLNNTSGGRFNPMFLPHHREKSEISKYILSNEELTYAYSRLLDAAIKYPKFDFRLFEEIKSALVGDFRSGCIFNRCDYLTTTCQTVLPDGGVARCDRCFQDGYFYTAEKQTNARWQMLEQTECKGCKYFVACTGGCPSEGRDGDFRSKTMYCESDYFMFQCVENILRKMFPGIILAIDVHNFYEDYFVQHKRINFLMRDSYFVDTKERMINRTKLLGWTPDSEKPKESITKHGYSHMDTNTSELISSKKSCARGDSQCSNK